MIKHLILGICCIFIVGCFQQTEDQLILQSLPNKDPTKRNDAMLELVLISIDESRDKNNRAEEKIIDLFENGSIEEQIEIVYAVGSFGGHAIKYENGISDLVGSTDLEISRTAIWGIKMMNASSPQTIENLFSVFESDHEELHMLTFETLIHISDSIETMERLLSIMEDVEDQMRGYEYAWKMLLREDKLISLVDVISRKISVPPDNSTYGFLTILSRLGPIELNEEAMKRIETLAEARGTLVGTVASDLLKEQDVNHEE